MSGALLFDAVKHEYRFEGELVPSVTKIIEPVYDFRFVKPEDLARAAAMGTAVHNTVAMAERGTLDEERTPAVLRHHLLQWRRFKEDCGYQPIAMGSLLYSQEYRYAGQDDTYGIMGEAQILIDIKTGSKYAAHELQTAGYKQMRIENGTLERDARRASLYISETGYNLIFHTDVNDRTVFLGLLTQYRWKQKHGL